MTAAATLLGLLLAGTPASAAVQEYVAGAAQAHCVAIDARTARHVASVCFRYTLRYDVRTLLGEPVVDNRIAWEIVKIVLRGGNRQQELQADGSMPDAVRAAFGNVRLTGAVFAGQVSGAPDPRWLRLRAGALKASGGGFGFDTPGSPDWDKLFVGGGNGCTARATVRTDAAKAIVERGVRFQRVAVCDARMGGFGALDKMLREACLVTTDGRGGTACSKPAAKKLSEEDALAASLAAALQKAARPAPAPSGRPAPSAADGAAMQAAEAALRDERAGIDRWRSTALSRCEAAKPSRPTSGGSAATLSLTSRPYRGPCDGLKGASYRSCTARLEQRRREARAARAEAARRKRAEDARDLAQRMAAYERDLARWPQTLAACRADVAKGYESRLAAHRTAVLREAKTIEANERSQRALGDSLRKALQQQR